MPHPHITHTAAVEGSLDRRELPLVPECHLATSEFESNLNLSSESVCPCVRDVLVSGSSYSVE